MRWPRRSSLFLLLSLFGHIATLEGATLFDPALRFRTLATDHFIIYFHQGEERIARRLAAMTEDTWTTLQRSFGRMPQRTHVVLVDQSELANGYATPLPRNTIVVSATWPPASDFIGDTDDWIRLVFTHEFTHIVHLDRSEGWARAVRDVLGRASFAFPNLYLPIWQIEGLATYEESVITGAGRLHAGDFGAVVREEARAGTLQPLDRVNGGLTDWPGGTAAYAYGLGFHQYLADRFGAESLGTLADATARRVPYTTPPVFKRIYGESLGTLWRDYESTLLAAATSAPAPDSAIRRITHDGFIVSGPRFDPYEQSNRRALSVVYSLRTADGFPALNRVALDGSSPRRITTRFLGSTTAVSSGRLYFDQQEIRRNVGVYSDIFAWRRADGRVTRVTTDSRLMDPDLSPDGTTLVCVQNKPGQRDLVLVSIPPSRTTPAPIATVVAEPETQFNAPRWSPDGKAIVVERHRVGSLSDVVIVDVQTRRVRVLHPDSRARFVTPAWRPDGRAIVAAIAAQDEPFNLYELSLDDAAPVRQLTRTTGGATWPDVSPDGRTVVFVGYTTSGFDLFTMPYPAATSLEVAAAPSSPANAVEDRPVTALDVPTYQGEPYSPFGTLLPTSWTPVIESDRSQIRVGVAVVASDALGYHAYAATATWLVSSPSGVPKPGAATPDWSAAYAYDRWRPTFWGAANERTSFLEGPATENGTPSTATLREREIDAGVIVPIQHTRLSQTASLSVVRAFDDYTMPDGTLSRDHGAARAAWAITSAHTYGFSISPEAGTTAGTTIDAERPGLGASAAATTVTGDIRAYVPSGLPHHVLAVRLAGGRATGDPTVRRTFHLGGALSNASVTDFGRDAISLLRGFPADTFAGSHVALMNVDYRFPLARPERGVGTFPVFLHTLHATVFGDAGHAWTRTFDAASIKTSVGAEISANIVAGYFFPLTATVGVARGHDGSGAVADRTTVYFRVGRAF